MKRQFGGSTCISLCANVFSSCSRFGRVLCCHANIFSQSNALNSVHTIAKKKGLPRHQRSERQLILNNISLLAFTKNQSSSRLQQQQQQHTSFHHAQPRHCCPRTISPDRTTTVLVRQPAS
eukprot:scaffold175_cov177-Amphora_coffeaeformis.AAC.28